VELHPVTWKTHQTPFYDIITPPRWQKKKTPKYSISQLNYLEKKYSSFDIYFP
jgi:hypothetical protein